MVVKLVEFEIQHLDNFEAQEQQVGEQESMREWLPGGLDDSPNRNSYTIMDRSKPVAFVGNFELDGKAYVWAVIGRNIPKHNAFSIMRKIEDWIAELLEGGYSAVNAIVDKDFYEGAKAMRLLKFRFVEEIKECFLYRREAA